MGSVAGLIRVLLADNHALFRTGTRRILEEQRDMAVVAEANSGAEAIDLAREHRPDVAILDIAMKGIKGIAATAEIVAQSPPTAILILSMYSDELYVVGSVRAGARGFLLKDSVEQGLLEAIRKVQAGQAFFSPSVAKTLKKRMNPDGLPPEVGDPYLRLTERERHIYQLLAEGNASKQVAADLGISVHTVETHRARIMAKMDLHGIAELVLSAVRHGLVS